LRNKCHIQVYDNFKYPRSILERTHEIVKKKNVSDMFHVVEKTLVMLLVIIDYLSSSKKKFIIHNYTFEEYKC